MAMASYYGDSAGGILISASSGPSPLCDITLTSHHMVYNIVGFRKHAVCYMDV